MSRIINCTKKGSLKPQFNIVFVRLYAAVGPHYESRERKRNSSVFLCLIFKLISAVDGALKRWESRARAASNHGLLLCHVLFWWTSIPFPCARCGKWRQKKKVGFSLNGNSPKASLPAQQLHNYIWIKREKKSFSFFIWAN